MSRLNLDQVESYEERPDHHYRTEIPNIILEWLKGDELIAYIHLKKICGDSGTCWKTTKNLAKQTGMSERQFRYMSDRLAEPTDFRPALITITERKKSDGSSDTNIIKIIDVWRLNGDHYRNKKFNRGTAHGAGGVLHDMQGGTAYGAAKEELFNKNPIEEDQQHPPTPLKGKAAAAEDKSFDSRISEADLDYIHPNGTKMQISASVIFRAMVPLGYTSEAILRALEKARRAKMIRDPIEYIKTIASESKEAKESLSLQKSGILSQTLPPKKENGGFKWVIKKLQSQQQNSIKSETAIETPALQN